jgi:AraC family transcriptional regulator
MIGEKQGVTVTYQQSWTEFGVEEVAYELRWVTEPGWLTVKVKAPTLCMMATEIGGRCELRAKADQLVEGEYFGSGALSFAAQGETVAIHAAEMREARLCCFSLHAADADFLTSREIAALQFLQSRFMFRSQRIRTCAALLDSGRIRGDANAAYNHSLSKALFAAVLEMGSCAYQRSRAPALSGAIWNAISRHMRDHLQEPITVETLSEIALMAPERFGGAFRDVTGMSVRQWQMDHRVRSAQRLLVDNPKESLAEVAILCGFADQSHFSRAFLRVVGLTPTAWLHSRT